MICVPQLREHVSRIPVSPQSPPISRIPLSGMRIRRVSEPVVHKSLLETTLTEVLVFRYCLYSKYTITPLKRGHFRTVAFVHSLEVVLSQRLPLFYF